MVSWINDVAALNWSLTLEIIPSVHVYAITSIFNISQLVLQCQYISEAVEYQTLESIIFTALIEDFSARL